MSAPLCMRSYVGALMSALFCRRSFIVRSFDGSPLPTSSYFWPILSPLLLSHFVTSRDPPKVRHTSRTPSRFLVGPVQKSRTKAPCANSLSIVRGGFCPGGYIRGSLVWKVLSGVVFVRSPFCQNTSATTES